MGHTLTILGYDLGILKFNMAEDTYSFTHIDQIQGFTGKYTNFYDQTSNLLYNAVINSNTSLDIMWYNVMTNSTEGRTKIHFDQIYDSLYMAQVDLATHSATTIILAQNMTVVPVNQMDYQPFAFDPVNGYISIYTMLYPENNWYLYMVDLNTLEYTSSIQTFSLPLGSISVLSSSSSS
ncbi:hypothetical protein SAMD00019534_085450 [Acytostelium subglobosum LB1]|uniref:hypothetical protein n=1 Tax=Acytostelium subglobosum LB1 TaxID=1410327 RepID=UPI0006451DDA|nr:hypothetical protein SAMD00019534_085450 [Acytostelium subglobosum LB1]GAM25370.1 hypothetical protein SAMD00019534_085450 [Acytostelium subglobosum LB1]|eukprot:XP_012751890.1 hypothetical protein SAMD00019534_085450 [Acytostelium subglobosum LB1]